MSQKIIPYPQNWARIIDMVTPLSIQQNIDPSVELNYFKGDVSVPMQQLTGDLKSVETNLGVSIKQDPILRKKTNIEWGSLNAQKTVSQKELWDNIVKNTILDETPTILGKMRGILTPVTHKLASVPALDGCEQVFRMEKSFGEYTSMMIRRTGIPLTSTVKMMRDILVSNDYLRQNDPVFKRMRSIWRTEWMVGLPRKGWSDLGSQGVADVSATLTSKKFHQDVGIPQTLDATYDSTHVQEQVYRLLKIGRLIAVG